MFDDIDHNHDGSINFFELYEALKKGQPSSQFDPNTVRILLAKYDSNRDNEINFEEFYQLFIGINEQMNEFLDLDADSSGTIEANELNQLLKNRRLRFSGELLAFLFDGIQRTTGSPKVTFDIYVRLIARLDNLISQHKASRSNQNLENYLKLNFFVYF
jgi:Ca2+-binding EF-hand superfamily protein